MPTNQPDIDPRNTLLDANGDGVEHFRAQKIGNLLRVLKITIETFVTSSGTVTIHKDGSLITASPLSPLMTAVGEGLEIHAGQEVTVTIDRGPNNSTIRISMHYIEVSAW